MPKVSTHLHVVGEVPISIGECPRYPFNRFHRRRLAIYGRFASCLLISVARSCRKMSGHCMLACLFVCERRQYGTSSIYMLEVRDETDSAPSCGC